MVLLDIETSPLTGYCWDTYQTNVLKVIEPSKIISVAWKELNADETFCKALPDYKGYKKGVVDDEKLIREVWKVLDEADILIAHYGNAFDFKKLNARFVWYGLTAPSQYKTVDTKSVAKKYFKFDANSLNALGTYLNVGQKINNGGFELWTRCLEEGDKDAWALMKEYNVQDVVLLEKIYLRLRPYMENHPSLSVLVENTAGDITCPTCLSHNIHRRGFSMTRTGRRQRFQCNDCGSWSSGPYVKSKNVLVNDDD